MSNFHSTQFGRFNKLAIQNVVVDPKEFQFKKTNQMVEQKLQ